LGSVLTYQHFETSIAIKTTISRWQGDCRIGPRKGERGMSTQLDLTKTGREAKNLEASLRLRVVGQDEAINSIVEIYQTYMAGMSPAGRPIASLMFLGPTGSGKTRLVEATAECLLNNPRAVIKIDCGEFQHSHEIARLIGSPPGYIGHRETHAALNQQALDRYHTEFSQISIVLFDEIEKASDALWNLLLGILDKGVLTLGDNSTVDFSRAMIFMTSNIGAREMNALVKPRLGFAAAAVENIDSDMSHSAIDAARRKFTPEFINRLDKMVVFKPLRTSELHRVLDIELENVQQRIFNTDSRRRFMFTLTLAAKNFLLSEGTDLNYGARHLKRAVERLLVQPLSKLIASDQITTGDRVRIDHQANSAAMAFTLEDEEVMVGAAAG
jgi:ATP-dependent Clp protease ATP-binding subunit ClpA